MAGSVLEKNFSKVGDAWDSQDISAERNLDCWLKWKKINPPVLPDVMEALLRAKYDPGYLYELVKDTASPPTIRKVITGQKPAYDENGEITPVARKIAGVLVKKPEDLFGAPPEPEVSSKPACG